MSYGNYAPFYRPGYFNPMQNMQMPVQNMPDTQFNSQYQPPMQGTPYQMPTQNQPTNDMVWVQGEAGAKAYPVAPNYTLPLWDSENKTIYLKTVNAQGIPSMEILDYNQRIVNAPKTPENHVCSCGNKFVTLEAFNALQVRLDELTTKFEELTTETTAKSGE